MKQNKQNKQIVKGVMRLPPFGYWIVEVTHWVEGNMWKYIAKPIRKIHKK